jgi:hypothetical protein
MATIPKAFEQVVVSLPITAIVAQLPSRGKNRKGAFARQIAASIKEVGLVEPLVVYRQATDRFLLLDGHVRLEVLKEMGVTETRCIIATDDEAFTYNRRVNTIPPIAQHLMILKALGNGLSEERIASALEVDVSVIRRKRDMLNGICPEAVEMLRDYKVNTYVFSLMRKMKPLRQVEVADHMIANATFSFPFAKALLYGTKSEHLVEPPKDRVNQPNSDHAANRLSQESDALLRDLKSLEESFGRDALVLTVCRGYVERLLSNNKVLRYLEKRHGESLNVLQLWFDNRRLGA